MEDEAETALLSPAAPRPFLADSGEGRERENPAGGRFLRAATSWPSVRPASLLGHLSKSFSFTTLDGGLADGTPVRRDLTRSASPTAGRSCHPSPCSPMTGGASTSFVSVQPAVGPSSEDCCTWLLASSLGVHRVYRDGKPRPLLRGWLHGGTALIFLVMLVLFLGYRTKLAASGHGSESAGDRGVLSLLLGKCAVMAASASYHLIPFSSYGAVRLANAVDLALIPLSIFASIAPFASANSEQFLHEVTLVVGILCFNIVVVVFQFLPSISAHPPHRGSKASGSRPDQDETVSSSAQSSSNESQASGGRMPLRKLRGAENGGTTRAGGMLLRGSLEDETKEQPRVRLDSDDVNSSKPLPLEMDGGSGLGAGRSWHTVLSPEQWSAVRHVILVFYFLYACVMGYRCVGLAPLLVTSAVLYVFAFSMAVVVDEAGHAREPVVPCLPHHTQGVWSLHEDFHVTLLLADVAWVLLALRYLYPTLSALDFAA